METNSSWTLCQVPNSLSRKGKSICGHSFLSPAVRTKMSSAWRGASSEPINSSPQASAPPSPLGPPPARPTATQASRPLCPSGSPQDPCGWHHPAGSAQGPTLPRGFQLPPGPNLPSHRVCSRLCLGRKGRVGIWQGGPQTSLDRWNEGALSQAQA